MIGLLTSFCQPPRCFNLSFYLVFQPRLSILLRKGQTATQRCPNSPGWRGEAHGLTIALKSSRCPYIQDLCHLVLTASPGEGDGREPVHRFREINVDKSLVHPFSFGMNRGYCSRWLQQALCGEGLSGEVEGQVSVPFGMMRGQPSSGLCIFSLTCTWGVCLEVIQNACQMPPLSLAVPELPSPTES